MIRTSSTPLIRAFPLLWCVAFVSCAPAHIVSHTVHAAYTPQSETPHPLSAARGFGRPIASAHPRVRRVISEHFAYEAKRSRAPRDTSRAPAIVEIDLNEQRVSAPGEIVARVVTSPNVNRVVAHVAGRSINIPQIQRGRFEGKGPVPALPFFLRGRDYDVVFEAETRDGRSAHATVPIHVLR